MKQKQTIIQNKIKIVEDKNDIVWAMDENYKLTAFNTSFKSLLKQNGSGDAERGMDLKQLYRTNYFFNPCEQGCDRALNRYATTSKHTFEENGQIVVHEFSFQPFTNSSGDVVGCCIWQKDITQEVNNNHRLQESERKYREAQKVTNVGHWSWDLKRDEITWSDQLYEIWGKIPGKFKKNYDSVVDMIHPEDKKMFIDHLNDCFQNNTAHDIVHRILLDSGEVKYIHSRGHISNDEKGEPYRMSGTAQDVTKDVLANQQIVQQNNELQNFVRIISHNLRGPISNLLMLSKIYEWGKDEMNDDIVKKIENTTEALDQTIKDLNLSLSMKNTDKERFREISLTEVMKDLDGLLSEETAKTNAVIKTDFSQAGSIVGLKSYFVNILYNLILNAINYAKEGVVPRIDISTQLTDDYILINVKDNGIGMELTPERERKIFNIYGRLSGETAGKGLGLYLVKTQVEAMDGKIEVESEKDVGTIFTITFPKVH